MPEEQATIDWGEAVVSWKVPEFEKHERTQVWYISAIVVALVMVGFAFWTRNYLFFGIVIIAAFVIILREGQEAADVEVSLTDEGLVIGKKFYDFDVLKNFAVVYKPKMGVKNLYFEFKNSVKQRISLPLGDKDPIFIREHLLKYLPEDLERTDQSLSEGLAKLLKI